MKRIAGNVEDSNVSYFEAFVRRTGTTKRKRTFIIRIGYSIRRSNNTMSRIHRCLNTPENILYFDTTVHRFNILIPYCHRQIIKYPDTFNLINNSKYLGIPYPFER